MEFFAAPPSSTTMDASRDLSTTRPRRTERTAHSISTQAVPPTYGYHNTFHTHAAPNLSSPPSYAKATSPATQAWMQEKAAREAQSVRTAVEPPPYSCTVEMEGPMGLKQELSSVFEISRSREWHDVYAVVRGTQLCIYRLKGSSLLGKNRGPSPGRLVKKLSLQHAEVGVAADFRKSALVPKSPFAHLLPVSARAKLYETDPQLFEPVREHAIRLRLETEQFLLSAKSQEDMLEWVETLCAAVDISPPLEDRSEPRYRSLPRRSRRQRVLDSARLGEHVDNLSSLDVGRRIIAEQEEIIRQLYPHLAGTAAQEPSEITPAPRGADLDRDEFDADDVRFPTRRPGSADSPAYHDDESGSEDRPSSRDSIARKAAPILRPSTAQALRYRRRCAPVLLACSPRVSDVVFSGGRRLRIITREQSLGEYKSLPPRYDAHGFRRSKRTSKVIKTDAAQDPALAKTAPANEAVSRPGSPLCTSSNDSLTSFGYDLSSATTARVDDEISAAPSEPPSPTSLSHLKAEATRELASKSLRKTSDETTENRLGSIDLGARLVV